MDQCIIYSLYMLEKLYQWDYSSAVADIMTSYQTHWSVVINFLYFANAMKWQLFEEPSWTSDFLQKRSMYVQALHQAQYFLPDGIALQVFAKFLTKKSLSNLNGTDFIPHLIQEISREHSVSLYLYQCYDPEKGKWEDSLLHWINALEKDFDTQVVWADQCHYQDRWDSFDWKELESKTQQDNKEVKIFLNCTWTPFQETWIYEHIDFFTDYWFLVCNAGWLIDYLTWYEKRAPRRIVKTRVLETFWRIVTHPKKNIHKFLAMFGVIRFLRKPFVASPKTENY